MAKLVWDAIGEHLYETGVDHVVLYTLDANNAYSNGFVWNGVSSINESPTHIRMNLQLATAKVSLIRASRWASRLVRLSVCLTELFLATMPRVTITVTSFTWFMAAQPLLPRRATAQ